VEREPVSAGTVGAYVVSTIGGQAVCTHMVSTIGSLTVGTDMVSTVGGQAVSTHVVSAIGSLTVCTDMVSAIGGEAVGTYMIGTIGSLTIRTGVRSVSVGRTTLGNHSTVQCGVSIRNRQSESTRCQDGKTKAKQNVRSFHDGCSN
jgi:hypothetical protein